MIEIMSLALGGISVLLNINSNSNAEQNKQQLLKALQDMDGLFLMLRTAKNGHDQFQIMQNFFASRPETLDKAKYEKLNKLKQRELCEKILGAPEALRVRISCGDIEEPKAGDTLNVPGGLDPNVQESATQAVKKYAEFYAALSEYEKVLYGESGSLTSMLDDDEFGDPLRKKLRKLKSEISRASGAADQVIVELSPVMSAAHHAIKTAVGKL